MYILQNDWSKQLQTLQFHMLHDIDRGSWATFYVTWIAKGQIMYLFVNTFGYKSLDVATLNFSDA